jgi:hypothetical protein
MDMKKLIGDPTPIDQVWSSYAASARLFAQGETESFRVSVAFASQLRPHEYGQTVLDLYPEVIAAFEENVPGFEENQHATDQYNQLLEDAMLAFEELHLVEPEIILLVVALFSYKKLTNDILMPTLELQMSWVRETPTKQIVQVISENTIYMQAYWVSTRDLFDKDEAEENNDDDDGGG